MISLDVNMLITLLHKKKLSGYEYYQINEFTDINELKTTKEQQVVILVVYHGLNKLLKLLLLPENVDYFNIGAPANNGINALYMACAKRGDPNSSEMALCLIETGKSNPGQITKEHKNTALIASIQSIKRDPHMTQVAIALINTGESNPGHVNNEDITALLAACLEMQSKVALALIKTGQANIEHVGSPYMGKTTALIVSCLNNMSDVAVALIRSGKSDPTFVDFFDKTALMYAEENRLVNVIALLTPTLKMTMSNISPPSLSEMAFDIIDGIDVVIRDYISSDFQNIAILVNKTWYLSNKKTIQRIINKNHSSIVYKCRRSSGLIGPTNVDKKMPYFRLRSIGIMLDFIPKIYITLLLDSVYQYFVIEPTNIILPSVVSHSVLYKKGTWVSAAHCQEGQGGPVYKMSWINPRITTSIKSLPPKSKSKSTQKISRKRKRPSYIHRSF